eukprot:m.153695 g.153695  ORF g.153695 m.153695 type:complete len:119 (+) comp14353_c0_seq9:237-593(+)
MTNSDTPRGQVRRREARAASAAENGSARFEDDPNSVKAQLEKEKKLSRVDLGVLFWLFLAILVTHYFDVVDAVMYDPRVDRDRLFWAAVMIGISVVAAAYAIIVIGTRHGSGTFQIGR